MIYSPPVLSEQALKRPCMATSSSPWPFEVAEMPLREVSDVNNKNHNKE
jgi:hypothetical protein